MAQSTAFLDDVKSAWRGLSAGACPSYLENTHDQIWLPNDGFALTIFESKSKPDLQVDVAGHFVSPIP
ncbi:predicted protein [Arabidopsis lyrata subsp. lyrata]|uniref:Predicted protein n=1 Tax=Arabidopsis lyrata subsp. lyrata TaxID=81972 RepID=D7LZI5_ARALL|nr:predicted protein [Arabidopsis lyrata subsp. lyrata]